MPAARRFTKPVVAAFDAAKIIGVRSGTAHRFTGVWIVVVDARVFARSWDHSATSWYDAFLAEPLGTLQVGDREVRVRGKKVRGERLLDRIDQAYAEKYDTKASQQYVRGFALPRRRAHTMEFVPR
jgi:hypothetical protein